MKQLNLFQPLIEELKNSIIDDLKPHFEELKKSYVPIKPNEYMSRKDVSAMLGINLSTLWSYTRSNKLVSYGIGNRVYYKRSEVESAIIELNPRKSETGNSIKK